MFDVSLSCFRKFQSCCFVFYFWGCFPHFSETFGEVISEILETVQNLENFGKLNLSNSCLEGCHSKLIRNQLLLWTTHQHCWLTLQGNTHVLKTIALTTITCIAIARNTTLAIRLVSTRFVRHSFFLSSTMATTSLILAFRVYRRARSVAKHSVPANKTAHTYAT